MFTHWGTQNNKRIQIKPPKTNNPLYKTFISRQNANKLDLVPNMNISEFFLLCFNFIFSEWKVTKKHLIVSISHKLLS